MVGARRGTPRPPRRVVMLCLVDVGSKAYIDGVSGVDQWRSELSCPDPGCEGAELVGHGGYRRYLGGSLQRIARLRCQGCRVTHGVLPADACPYRDLTLVSLESVWEAEVPSAALGQLDPPGACALRSLRGVLRKMKTTRSALRSLLPASPARGLAGLRSVFGPAPGVLVRVRDWLWSRYRLWFSGLCGLWRHGRPPHLDRGRSTNLGRPYGTTDPHLVAFAGYHERPAAEPHTKEDRS